MRFDWQPSKRVGPFVFGASIQPHRQNSTVEFDESCDGTGWDCFSHDDDAVMVYVEDDLIVSVACYEYCYYQGLNLIEMDYATVERLLGEPNAGCPDLIELDDGVQAVYDFDELGAQVWAQEGTVVSISFYDGRE